MNYEWSFHFLWQYEGLIAKGIGITLGFTILTVILGLLVGMVIALGRMTKRRWLAVPDILYQGQLITSATYRPLETYTMVALVYFAILYPLTWLATQMERRLARRP